VNSARDAIFAGIRHSLGRGTITADKEAELRARAAAHRRNLIPERAAGLDHSAQIELFVAMAEAAQATVTRVPALEQVPEAVARYLAAENLAAELAVAPDPSLDSLPWQLRPLLRIRRGRAESADAVSLTPCFAAIAETGTLMLTSGAGTPTTLNFLPDTHIVMVHADQVVASYEDGWDRLRAIATAREAGPHGLPRAVNFITGPSRTGDIEQQIVLGAHGPRRLHILVVENRQGVEHGQGGA
jgi:L-lactate dehydrogenase complex protein LldG